MSDEDGELFDSEDEGGEEVGRKPTKKRKGSSNDKAKSKKSKFDSFIDDSAELSGEEDDDDDEEEEDDENENDYVKDGFVVDEVEEEKERRKKGDLEDSDSDDDDDDDDEGRLKKKRKKIRKLRDVQQLDEDDLDLINEARGIKTHREIDAERREREAAEERRIQARNADELRKGLFTRTGESDDEAPRKPTKKRTTVERYDEDGMDDFIDDDIGDQGDIIAQGDREYGDSTGVSEAQLNEASEIFGTDYLEYMQEEERDNDDEFMASKYREKGVGVDYGVESDEESEDDDLFGDDDDDDDDENDPTGQKAEARRLRREKKAMSKAERRRKARLQKAQRQKAELRKNFEPVQLIENFCTERDDEIRMKDAPERFFDWTVPFHGPTEGSEIADEEEEEAMWIMSRVPEISTEFFSPPIHGSDEDPAAAVEKHQKSVLNSIVHALRFMHREHLEPSFIKRYRADIVTASSVRENVYAIMDEDAEWDRLTSKRATVEDLLGKISSDAESDEAKGAEETNVLTLKEELQAAQEKLEETAKEERELQEEIGNLESADDEEDDDDLFGKDDDEAPDEEKEKKQKERDRLSRHLKTITEMLQDRVDRVSRLTAQLQSAEARNTESLNAQGPALNITKKMCRGELWNLQDYETYLAGLTDERGIDDIKTYLTLVKEGNDAIRKKESPNGGSGDSNQRKRSRSVNHDLYRSRVADGLRQVVYKFMLAPIRVGVKMEHSATVGGDFNYLTIMSGENDEGDPLRWIAPKLDTTPTQFATELIGSGELVFSQGGDIETESADPLSGCRFVAAIELAYEPRTRKVLRNIFRDRAVLTTRPTKKGLDTIDAFHDYFGLHLIKDKPIKDHFPMDEKESHAKKMGMGAEEIKELESEMKRREQQSCLQYLRILEAEHFSHISLHVHMPYKHTNDDSWYKESRETWANRDNQDLSPLMDVLEKAILPPDGDTEAWNQERKKVIAFALKKVILPEFEQELRRDLRDAATKVGIDIAGKNLREMSMQGAYRPASLMGENRFLYPTGDLPIVGVCCPSDGKEATYFAATNERGEMSDHFPLASGQRIDNPKIREKLITFLMQSRPAAVVIGTSGGFQARLLVRKLGEVVTQATDQWNNRRIQGADEDDEEFERRKMRFERMNPAQYDDDDYDETWKCSVDLIDDTVPQLFGRSVRGKKEFPEKEVNLKCAIAIARQAKDPLAELTYAWNVASDAGVFGTELLYLNIYSMQRYLPKTRLLRQYERVLCEAVADVGVDINTSCAHDHLLGSLSFVAGLGPRKAASLKQSLARIGGTVASRRALLEKRLLGPVVYNNAIAFLRVRDSVEQLANQFLHPLDDTRLHPDVYHRNNWAIKIAIDALERLEDSSRDKESFGIKALRDVIDNSQSEVERLFKDTRHEWELHYGPTFDVAAWDPRINVPVDFWKDKVEELDLDAFANMIEESGVGKWNSHLKMIKWEFRLPYEDPRKPMQPLSGEKLFKLITGETDQTLRPGKEVTGKVVKNGDFGSRVKLEGDIPAFIPLRALADEHVEAAEDIVSVGAVVTAVITEVKKDHFTVDMSLRMEDFRKGQLSWPRPQSLDPLDICFDNAAAQNIEQEKSKEREGRLEALRLKFGPTKLGEDGTKKSAGKISRRACAHPAFRNARNDEVSKELKEGGDDMVGEALIRPSNKNSDCLAVHWLVKPGSIKIIEVTEEEKDTDASIGKKLKIKDETYGSIDEILGRFIAPMNDHVEMFASHRKFVDLPEDDVDEKLKEQKKTSPNGVFYNLCWMEMHPGYGSIRFITGNTPRHHLIGIHPKGFAWGPKVFSDLDALLNDFKKNPRGHAPKPPSNRTPPPPPGRPTEPRNRWGARTSSLPPPPPGRPSPPAIPVGGGNRWGGAAAPTGYPPRSLQQDLPPPPPGPPGYQAPPNFPPPSNFQRPPPPPPMGRPPPPPAYR